ncbi:MAG: hypothetical protein INR62_03105 [Rhodospirillales bacterium]|nr:hypothetical protein [Acetobacter sp.]
MQKPIRVPLLPGAVFCILLLVCFCFRLSALIVAVLSITVLVFVPSLRCRSFRWSALAAFVVLSLLPFDVSFTFRPGPPRVKRLVYGLPSKHTMEAAQRGEVVLGGCMPSGGYEPTWILVW